MGGELIALIDVVPEDTEINFEKLIKTVKKVLSKECTLETYEVIPIAFGLKKARLRIRFPDEWGSTEKIEKMLEKLDGVQGIEAVAFSKA